MFSGERKQNKRRAEATHDANAETQRLETDQTYPFPQRHPEIPLTKHSAPPMLQGGIKKLNDILKRSFSTLLSELGSDVVSTT
jgi:hypothetical protein